METGSIHCTNFESNFAKQKFHQFACFLYALLEAREYASDLRCSAWDFAIDFSDAQTMGVAANDLLWMARKGWIQTGVHSGAPSGRGMAATVPALKGVGTQSQFVINERGLEIIRTFSGTVPENRAESLACPPSKSVPTWDAQRHELTLDGRLIKRFRWPATNQEVVLTAFEEDAWPSRIDDPLPGSDDLEPKRRLSDTIKCLNRNQCVQLLRFRGDGTGEGIIWDVIHHPGR